MDFSTPRSCVKTAGRLRQRAIPEELNHQLYRCENLKTRISEEHFGHCFLSNERLTMGNKLEISQPDLFKLNPTDHYSYKLLIINLV
jgi:hypothetical protein